MDKKYFLFPSAKDLAEAFAIDLVKMIKEAEKENSVFTIALSGGNTPKLLFAILAEKHSKSVDWSLVHFFWGDERCVSPDDPESNYGVAYQIFFSRIKIPEENIHRIRGEGDPEGEAVRYSKEIAALVQSENSNPMFDLFLLGIGDDGHIASIFPDNMKLLESCEICEVAVHPETGQKRITMTGKVINNSGAVYFLVTGQNKARIIESIFKRRADSVCFPASFIVPVHGCETWLLDEEAGRYI